jgi:hypothetical protein
MLLTQQTGYNNAGTIVDRNFEALCDKVCPWVATGLWFSPGTPVSSTYKTDRHDITEILLKLTLNNIHLTLTQCSHSHLLHFATTDIWTKIWTPSGLFLLLFLARQDHISNCIKDITHLSFLYLLYSRKYNASQITCLFV